MAAIEPLLGIVQMKKANGLLLTSDEVPRLLLDGASVPLTMAPLSAGMLDDLIESVLAPEQRELLVRAGRVQSTYASQPHGSYAVEVRAADGKVTLTLSTLTNSTSARAAVPATPEGRQPAMSAGALGSLLDQAVERRASDVLLSAGAPPLLRVDGVLVELTASPVSEDELLAACEPFLGAAQCRQLDDAGSVDFAVVHASDPRGDGQRFRANLFRHERGLALALRSIWTEVPSLEELHLPDSLAEFTRPRTGLVLVAGSTGAGKSTTLSALLEQVNRTRSCHIVTLEDPIEYLYPRRRAVVHQREVGRHVDSFASGLRAALRENPDIILLGEMRDPETIRLALTAAETGHLVLSTIHSGGAVMAIERIVDVFAEGEKLLVRTQLAGVLRQVVAQQLVPAARGGLFPALEIMAVTHAVAAQIREGRTHMLGTQMEIGAEQGMIPMHRALADLARAGQITRAAALAAAPNPTALEHLLDDRSTARR
jgi:twitching motility protein PilT